MAHIPSLVKRHRQLFHPYYTALLNVIKFQLRQYISKETRRNLKLFYYFQHFILKYFLSYEF